MSPQTTLGSLQSEFAASLEQPPGHPARVAAELAGEAATALLRGHEELERRAAKLKRLRATLNILNRELSERAIERSMRQERAAADLIDWVTRHGKVELPEDETVLFAERACAVVKRANEMLALTNIPLAEYEHRAAEVELLLLEAKAYGSHAAWRGANLASKLGAAVEFDSSISVEPGAATKELTRLSNERLQQHAAGIADLQKLERSLNK